MYIYISATVPSRHEVECTKVENGSVVLWTWAWIWIWFWLFLLKGSPGVALKSPCVSLFSCFFSIVLQPSKMHLLCPLGANMVPK